MRFPYFTITVSGVDVGFHVSVFPNTTAKTVLAVPLERAGVRVEQVSLRATEPWLKPVLLGKQVAGSMLLIYFSTEIGDPGEYPEWGDVVVNALVKYRGYEYSGEWRITFRAVLAEPVVSEVSSQTLLPKSGFETVPESPIVSLQTYLGLKIGDEREKLPIYVYRGDTVEASIRACSSEKCVGFEGEISYTVLSRPDQTAFAENYVRIGPDDWILILVTVSEETADKLSHVFGEYWHLENATFTFPLKYGFPSGTYGEVRVRETGTVSLKVFSQRVHASILKLVFVGFPEGANITVEASSPTRGSWHLRQVMENIVEEAQLFLTAKDTVVFELNNKSWTLAEFPQISDTEAWRLSQRILGEIAALVKYAPLAENAGFTITSLPSSVTIYSAVAVADGKHCFLPGFELNKTPGNIGELCGGAEVAIPVPPFTDTVFLRVTVSFPGNYDFGEALNRTESTMSQISFPSSETFAVQVEGGGRGWLSEATLTSAVVFRDIWMKKFVGDASGRRICTKYVAGPYALHVAYLLTSNVTERSDGFAEVSLSKAPVPGETVLSASVGAKVRVSPPPSSPASEPYDVENISLIFPAPRMVKDEVEVLVEDPYGAEHHLLTLKGKGTPTTWTPPPQQPSGREEQELTVQEAVGILVALLIVLGIIAWKKRILPPGLFS